MSINDIFQQRRKNLNSLLRLRKNIPTGDICECPVCQTSVSRVQLRKRNNICINCNYYFPMTPMERISLIGDEKSFHEMSGGLTTKNPLKFPGYDKKLEDNKKKTGTEDAIVTGVLKIKGMRAAVGVLDSRFLMGSMGTVVGEKIAKLAEYADKRKLPLIIFSASGGARMQEGLFSLMQMAKTSAAVERFKQNGGLFISCLTNPTTGGVSASFASLGDIIIAEPKALICFAGPRVIEQTIGEKLPDGFQKSEFLLEHGMIDMVVERTELKNILYRLIVMHRR
jgi:acetyl-CoA carboxylase carboxyl transferase subunit beta